MCELLCLFFVLLTIIVLAAPSTSSKQFRTDYIYNSVTDAFYKLHTETEYYYLATNICTSEGATLMVPTSEHDVSQVHGMLKKYSDIGNYVWINDDGKNHVSAEEIPLINLDDTTADREEWRDHYYCDCMTRDGDVKTLECFRQLPFVCKVDAKDVIFNNHCMVYSNDYQYYNNVGSCYKIPRVTYSWNQAYAHCRAEGAHLVVLNSEIEHEVIFNLTNAAPVLPSSQNKWFYLAGIRAEKENNNSPVVFKTIFNQTLQEAGYNQWSENEPNNYMSREYCGSIFKNDGKYNDIDCTHFLGFICEIEVKNT